MLWASPFHLLIDSILKLAFLWIGVLSPATFKLWGIHTEGNDFLFSMAILFLCIHLQTGPCPRVCSSPYVPSSFNDFWGVTVSRPLITLVCFLRTHYIRGEALLRWAVGWSAMLQAFISSVQSPCKPKRPDTQRPSFPAVLLPIFICLRSPSEHPLSF